MEPLSAISTTKQTNESTEESCSEPPGEPDHSPSEINLSRYFPRGTNYFYGYPSGEDSNFFNGVPPASEELVAARSLVCAGEHVKPIVFSPSIEPRITHMLKDVAGVAIAKQNQIITLPANITHSIVGKERNTLIKRALRELSDHKNLVMAQPFLDPDLQDRFQIDPELTILLNDKKNLPAYVPQEYLPERYGEYASGSAFAATSDKIPVPCVVKVSSSSSGDGVRLCRTAAQFEKAKKEYASVSGSIIVEQFIKVAQNFGIQIGIPSDKRKSVEIIGVSEQLTTPEGEFIGGIIDPLRLFPEIDGINRLLLDRVLPTVREMGWYGVGGFDVLIDKDGKFYIEDPNFRMTGMTPYLCEARNGIIRKSMVSFIASFQGTEEDFQRAIVPLCQEKDLDQLVHLIALTHHGDTFRMNAAMYFEQEEIESVKRNAERLVSLGLESKALRKLSENGRTKYPDFPEE